jgi:hypothetical protein
VNAVPDIAFAAVLALASVLSILVGTRAKQSAREYLLFAAALYTALAAADVIAAIESQVWSTQLADTIALIAAALAPVVLVLAIAAVFEGTPKPFIAAPILVLACLAGLAAALTGAAFIALAPLAASVCAMLALAARRWRIFARAPAQAAISATALLASAAAFRSGGQTAFALFSAAALLGASLAATKPLYRTVETPRRLLDLRVTRQS